MFRGCTNLTTLSVGTNPVTTGVIDLRGATFNGVVAFGGCTAITTVKMPAGAAIPNETFNGCAGLMNVEFFGATPPAFGDNVFYSITGPITVTVPAGSEAAYRAALAGLLPAGSTIIAGLSPAPTSTGSSDRSGSGYRFTGGANGQWVKGSKEGFTVTLDIPFDKFLNVELNGKAIAADSYIAKTGSTIVTLKPEYLQTLPSGKHTLVLVFSDAYAQTTLTITDSKKSNPNTGAQGNTSGIAVWAVALLAAGAVAARLRRAQKA